MDWDSLTGWVEDMDLDPLPAAIALIVTLYLAISFFDDPFNMGMNKLPLVTRIITVVAAPFVFYFVGKFIADK